MQNHDRYRMETESPVDFSLLLDLLGINETSALLVSEAIQPRPDLASLPLELFDGRGLLQSQANVIQTIEQTMTAERFDFERNGGLAVGPTDFQFLEIHFKLKPCLGIRVELLAFILRQYHRKKTVLHGVGLEDLSKGRSDDGTNAKVEPNK